MKKGYIIGISLLTILTSLFSYSEEAHQKLFEEGVKFLEKQKKYTQLYQVLEQKTRYQSIYEGTRNEDEKDVVFANNNYEVAGIDNLTEKIMQGELIPITHFWDADNYYEGVRASNWYGHNIVSGSTYKTNYTILNVPSAYHKAKALLGNLVELGFKDKVYDCGKPKQSHAFRMKNGELRYFYSMDGKYRFTDLTGTFGSGNLNIKLTGYLNEAGQYATCDYDIVMHPTVYNIFVNQNPGLLNGTKINADPPFKLDTDVEFNYLGRVIHLISDQAIPAHVHNDNHGPGFDPLSLEWYTSSCDQYEGWNIGFPVNGKGGFLSEMPNLFWNCEMVWACQDVLNGNSGLLDIGYPYSDPKYLEKLMYSVNQIADMFASDDISGDFNYLVGYPLIDYYKQRVQDLVKYFPDINKAHEIKDDRERIAIRDILVPLTIRAIATIVDWYAFKKGWSPSYLYLSGVLKSGDYKAPNIITNDQTIIDGNSVINLTATEKIILQSGFKVYPMKDNSKIFRAKIGSL